MLRGVGVRAYALGMHQAVHTKALKLSPVAAKALAQAASKLSPAEQMLLRARQERKVAKS